MMFDASRSVRLLALATLAAAPMTLPGSAHAQTATAPSADLVAVSRAIRAITTLKANFEQHEPNGAVQTGTVLLKQPGHIRFDYRKGDLLVIADGKSLNMIDYEVSQVQRLPIGSTPLGALLDPTRDLTRYGRIMPSNDPGLVSVAARDAAHPEYGTLTLTFTRKPSAPGGLELMGWVVQDAQGNRTVIRLTNLSHGAPIADSAFRWRDPRPNMRGPRR